MNTDTIIRQLRRRHEWYLKCAEQQREKYAYLSNCLKKSYDETTRYDMDSAWEAHKEFYGMAIGFEEALAAIMGELEDDND